MKKNNTFKKVLKAYQLFSLVYTGYVFASARGLGKEDDRHLIGKAIDRIGGYDIKPDKTVTIDDTEMYVSYNPYLQLFTGSLGGIAVVLNGTTNVYTDNHFRNMSKDTQYAVLCHEMGHYKLEHKPDATYKFDRIKTIYLDNSVLDIELEADEYAATIVGPNTMIIALCDLSRIHGISKKELILRIRNILAKQNELYNKFIINSDYDTKRRERINSQDVATRYKSLVNSYTLPRRVLKAVSKTTEKRGDK